MKHLAGTILTLSLTTTLAFAESNTQTTSREPNGQAKSKPAAKAAGKVSEAQACAMIARRPEVRAWKRQIAAAKSRGVSPHIELDRTEGGEHVVHVYEDVPDGDGSSHTATFNWYYVNQRNGKMRKEF